MIFEHGVYTQSDEHHEAFNLACYTLRDYLRHTSKRHTGHPDERADCTLPSTSWMYFFMNIIGRNVLE